jgi:2-polyprenyl-3-methyl-5-hydroxy-6-metoxy-1,4-benzoquinol methylase
LDCYISAKIGKAMALEKSIDNCQICGHAYVYKLITKSKAYNGATLQSSWVECANCGSAHIDPYPTADELLRYYSIGYVEMDFEGTSDLHSSHKLHYSSEYEKVVFKNYGFSLQDAGLHNLKQKSILDYGCATGLFYKYLTTVCDVAPEYIFGVDVESDMLDKCRKKYTNNFYSTDQTHLIGQRFDLITMWNVIEHIHDPKKALASIIDLLKNDGEILVETPRFGVLAKKFGQNWAHYLTFEHINLFSRDAIKKLFKDFGMECISESSFGANIFGEIDPAIKFALDSIAKEQDFGATQVLRFKKDISN